jgi:rhodanese-related sulfurtransferase
VNSLLIGLALVAGVLVLRALFLRSRRTSKEDLMELIKHGAQIVDVRTPQEFAQAHAVGSLNIPLDQLTHRAAELDRSQPVVVCCASGARSSMAKSLLERAGFSSVHNAGPWQAVPF